jgi:hypothetical protein
MGLANDPAQVGPSPAVRLADEVNPLVGEPFYVNPTSAKAVPHEGSRRAAPLPTGNPLAAGTTWLATTLAQSETRAQDLVPIRHGRMAASPWTYFRGAAAAMATDLASTPNTGIKVQLCGDAHVLNVGL